MDIFVRICFLIFIALIAPPLYADIYVWTDEDGVKHFSNQDPPENAEIITKTKEIPHDEEADRARRETERLEQIERDRLALLRREEELERREWEADQRIAEANRKAEEALRRAENVVQQVENYEDDTGRSRYYIYSGYYRYPYYKRWYYREDGNIYYKRKKPVPHHKKHEKYSRKGTQREYNSGKVSSNSHYNGKHSYRLDSRTSKPRSFGTNRSRGFNSGARTRGFSGRR